LLYQDLFEVLQEVVIELGRRGQVVPRVRLVGRQDPFFLQPRQDLDALAARQDPRQRSEKRGPMLSF
jgi:hypothetical protein